MLAYHDSCSLLASYGIEPPAGMVARNAEEAASWAEVMATPVALKLLAPHFSHKSDVGLVVLDLRGSRDVREAAERLVTRIPNGEAVEGILVQPMVRPSVELILGALVDPTFGPVVALGAGGVDVERQRGVEFLRPPFSSGEAAQFIMRNSCYPLLSAPRGSCPADLEKLREYIEALSRLILERRDEIESVDLNPVAVRREDGSLAVIDVRIEEKRSVQ